MTGRRVRAALAVGVLTLATACGSDPAGRALLVDDTGLDDVADGGGWVAFVPLDRVDDLWRAVGDEPDELAGAFVPLTRDVVESVGGETRTVSSDGEFDLGPTGALLVCRVSDEDALSRGCVETELDEGSRLTLTYGEGGLFVRD